MPTQIQENTTVGDHTVQELISSKPNFIVRWGITIFFFILLCFCIMCWFIQYPDVIKAPAILTSINAPKSVISKTDGKLIKLLVKEGEKVSKGIVLGYAESIGDPNAILKLSKIIDNLSELLYNNQIEQIPTIFTSVLQTNTYTLGELQQAHQTFTQAFITFKNYLSNGFFIRKKAMLYDDKANFNHLQTQLIQQKNLLQQDLSLSQQTFNANESLKNDSVISGVEYRTEKSKLINRKITIPQINVEILRNQAQQNETQKQIVELDNQIAQQKTIFQQALLTFKSQIKDWEQKYIFIAPINGKVSFTNFLQEKQQLRTGQIICFINPENSEYYAQVLIPQANFGKIKLGQQVLLKFAAYPSQEFGSVIGKVDFISHIPTDSGYMARIVLPNGLTTNYHKSIQYYDGLIAQADIITEDLRLLERFYYNIVKHLQ